MVTFSCDSCSEILTKKKVAIHILRCYNFLSVSCIDCNINFLGDNYKSHKHCVSESERFKISGFRQSLSTANRRRSQQNAQEKWTELLKKSIPSAPDLLKPSLQKLINFDNVPRKKKEFVNFVRNSLSIPYTNSDLLNDSLWNFLYTLKNEPFDILSNSLIDSLEIEADGEKRHMRIRINRYQTYYNTSSSSCEIITSESNDDTNICNSPITQTFGHRMNIAKKVLNYEKEIKYLHNNTKNTIHYEYKTSEKNLFSSYEKDIIKAIQEISLKELLNNEKPINHNTLTNLRKFLRFNHGDFYNSSFGQQKKILCKSDLDKTGQDEYYSKTLKGSQKLKLKKQVRCYNVISKIIFMELLKSFSKTSSKKVKLKNIQRYVNKKFNILNQYCRSKAITNHITKSSTDIWALDYKKEYIFLL